MHEGKEQVVEVRNRSRDPEICMGAVCRHRFQYLRDHRFDLRIANHARRPRSRLVEQTFQFFHPETLAPLADGGSGDMQLVRYGGILMHSLQPSTIRARMAAACKDFGRRANIVSFSFSSVVTCSGLVERPNAISHNAPSLSII